MAKVSYVDIETPKDVQEKALQAVEMAKDTGRLRKGINEATKAAEKGEAVLIVIAEDVDPPEVVMHLPMIAREKKVPYVFVAEKKVLGKSAGLEVQCSAIAVEKAGSAASIVDEIVSRMGAKKQKEAKAAKEEAPAEGKAEAPAEEKKEKPKRAPRKKKGEEKKEEEKVEEKTEEKKEEKTEETKE